MAGSAPGEDRLDAARRLAGAIGSVVLLKGPLTAVASPDGTTVTPDVLLSDAGGPALATAGSGDVLSGVIGAFCARGLGALEAAALAADVHGRAASLGPAHGLVAGDLPALGGAGVVGGVGWVRGRRCGSWPRARRTRSPR